MKNNVQTKTEILKTYAEYEHKITARHLELGCYLVMVLMPAGVFVDHYVYPAAVGFFFQLRLCAAFLALGLWGLLHTEFSKKITWFLSLTIALIPSFFICWMIYATDGKDSPYYAGLNLVLLAIALVMRWSVGLSVTASAIVMGMYLSSCFLHGPIDHDHYGVFMNNIYFLALTAIIVVAGGRAHRLLRIQEFTLRFELDQHQKALEESNRKLVELDQIKSRFFANISHELRTPLTLLLAPLETLMQKFNRSFDGETREVLATMHSNGMRLLKLINDLLDLVRLESGKLEVKHEALNVVDFVKGLASAARQVADDKRLRLETIVDP